MRRRSVLLSVLVAGLLVAPSVASAGKGFSTELIACSTPGFAVCFLGGGNLTFYKGSIHVDADGEVTVDLRGVSGATAVEAGPPYTLQVFFFNIPAVNQTPTPVPPPVGMPFTTKVKSDAFGNFSGSIGTLTGPAVGFFTINSAGPGGDFVNYQFGAREQFISGIH